MSALFREGIALQRLQQRQMGGYAPASCLNAVRRRISVSISVAIRRSTVRRRISVSISVAIRGSNSPLGWCSTVSRRVDRRRHNHTRHAATTKSKLSESRTLLLSSRSKPSGGGGGGRGVGSGGPVSEEGNCASRVLNKLRNPTTATKLAATPAMDNQRPDFTDRGALALTSLTDEVNEL